MAKNPYYEKPLDLKAEEYKYSFCSFWQGTGTKISEQKQEYLVR